MHDMMRDQERGAASRNRQAMLQAEKYRRCEVSHTPGPWEYEECLGARLSLISGGGLAIAGVPNVDPQIEYSIPYGIETQRANARLIAAAPEMLAVLKHISRAPCILALLGESSGPGLDGDGGPCYCAGCVARRTIAKAEPQEAPKTNKEKR